MPLFKHCIVGAGWGGCAVSLVAESQVSSFIQKIKETYPPYKDLEGEKLNEVIFATRPSSGACGEFSSPFLFPLSSLKEADGGGVVYKFT